MGKYLDLSGMQFGKLSVVKLADRPVKHGNRFWVCRCECGNDAEVSGFHLKSGHTTSCGCVHREMMRNRATHGHTKGRNISPTYQTWGSMIKRCRNPTATNFERYGGRGIKVCDRWSSFELFLQDMGERPSTDHEIDRIDNDGDYEPGNCRWVTSKKNSRNRRSTKIISTPKGDMSVMEASEVFSINYGTLNDRIKRGWTGDRLFEPANDNRKKQKSA